MRTTPTISIPPDLPVTALQTDFARGLQRRLHLSNHLLDAHCVARFNRPFAELDRADCSALIDELQEWTAIPAEVMREAGQLDLKGFEE